LQTVTSHPNVRVLTEHMAVDLLTTARYGLPNACFGAYVLDVTTGEVVTITAHSVLLASGKFDFHAIDGSRPMISRTRERVAGIIGATEAEQRVKLGSMDDLGSFSDGFFHLIVALGIYHQSVSWDHWRKCISESARVLEVGGLVLISAFTPDSQPDGEPLKPVHEKQNMYEGFSSGPLCLLGQSDHDLAMASLGFGPFAPTETVRVETELGFRYTMNALYRKG